MINENSEKYYYKRMKATVYNSSFSTLGNKIKDKGPERKINTEWKYFKNQNFVSDSTKRSWYV